MLLGRCEMASLLRKVLFIAGILSGSTAMSTAPFQYSFSSWTAARNAVRNGHETEELICGHRLAITVRSTLDLSETRRWQEGVKYPVDLQLDWYTAAGQKKNSCAARHEFVSTYEKHTLDRIAVVAGTCYGRGRWLLGV